MWVIFFPLILGLYISEAENYHPFEQCTHIQCTNVFEQWTHCIYMYNNSHKYFSKPGPKYDTTEKNKYILNVLH